MKIKADIIEFREKVKKVMNQTKVITDNQVKQSEEVKALNGLVGELAKTTNELVDAVLALLRQQIGD